MDGVNSNSLMERNTMDNGLIIKAADMQSRPIKVEIAMKAILKKIRNMDMVFIIGKMAGNMKAGGILVKSMDSVFSMIRIITFNTPYGNMVRMLVRMMMMELHALKDWKLNILMTLKIHKAQNCLSQMPLSNFLTNLTSRLKT